MCPCCGEARKRITMKTTRYHHGVEWYGCGSFLWPDKCVVSPIFCRRRWVAPTERRSAPSNNVQSVPKIPVKSVLPTKRFSINCEEITSSDSVNLPTPIADTPQSSNRAKPRSHSKRRFSVFPEALATPLALPAAPVPSKRYLRVLELLETERNYVNILDTVLDIIRCIPLDTDHPNSIFLHAEFVNEINTTFSQLPNLLRTHRHIVADLEAVMVDWQEDASIGAIFTKHGPDLEAYVPFVNSFEKIKMFLVEWEAKCKRFHAYLQFRQMQPGSGRQHLHDLLIRPVQRVPSVVSLLRDIKNKTDDSNPDSEELEKAIKEVQRVLSFINEQKREAEILALFQDIECRPTISRALTDYSAYICHLECVELENGQFHEKESTLIMILFHEVIEICKKREVNAKRHSQLDGFKQWEHVDFIPLARITELIDVPDGPHCRDAFALALTSVDDEQCRYKFAAFGEFQCQKSAFLRRVAAQIMTTTVRDRHPGTPVLRRITSEDMRIRTTTVLAVQEPGLKRSVTRLVRRLTRAVFVVKKLCHTVNKILLSSHNFHGDHESSTAATVSNATTNITRLHSRPASIFC